MPASFQAGHQGTTTGLHFERRPGQVQDGNDDRPDPGACHAEARAHQHAGRDALIGCRPRDRRQRRRPDDRSERNDKEELAQRETETPLRIDRQ